MVFIVFFLLFVVYFVLLFFRCSVFLLFVVVKRLLGL